MENFDIKKIINFVDMYKKAIGAVVLFVTLFLPIADVVTSSSGFFGYGAGTNRVSVYLKTVLNIFGDDKASFRIQDISYSSSYGLIMFTIQLYILTLILAFLFLFINKKKYSLMILIAYFVSLVTSIALFFYSTSDINNSTILYTTIKINPSWGYFGLLLFGLISLFSLRTQIKGINLHNSMDTIEDTVTHEIPLFAKEQFDASSDKVTAYFQFIEKSFKNKNYEKLITYLGFPLILIIALLSIEGLRIITFWALFAVAAYVGFKYIVAQEVNKAKGNNKSEATKSKKSKDDE